MHLKGSRENDHRFNIDYRRNSIEYTFDVLKNVVFLENKLVDEVVSCYK